ncbi:hypothetical protein [Dermatobacter hominis]|uniref:hypothetical protein n=1 Tax=Dermatobacter hominis TaxID=2884263 RepID=UPI001D106A60|nr:hypothetical protein [Dermatobacter hominis]UDY36218.1 hypothetical protein LH044_01465 [Dermatobacter hominis]
MSSLWTPDGERPVGRGTADAADAGPDDAAGAPPEGTDPLRAAAAALGLDLDRMTDEDRAQLEVELNEMMQVRRQVAATPAAEMLTNYLMRFFDLATIYLEADPPAFAEAATVIEAFRSVLDGVGDRLGDSEPLLREALGQAQMVFVQVKNATEGA